MDFDTIDFSDGLYCLTYCNGKDLFEKRYPLEMIKQLLRRFLKDKVKIFLVAEYNTSIYFHLEVAETPKMFFVRATTEMIRRIVIDCQDELRNLPGYEKFKILKIWK